MYMYIYIWITKIHALGILILQKGLEHCSSPSAIRGFVIKPVDQHPVEYP